VSSSISLLEAMWSDAYSDISAMCTSSTPLDCLDSDRFIAPSDYSAEPLCEF
jgi:hypothetical protein